MRLIDMVVQAPAVERRSDANGRTHVLKGPGAFAATLRECPLRYILDRAASEQCAAVFIGTASTPTVDDEVLRLPADTLWVEFLGGGNELELDGSIMSERVGILLEAAPGGRSGQIHCFASGNGVTRRVPGTLFFDLENRSVPPANGLRGHRLRYPDPNSPRVNEILEHARLVMDRDWVDYTQATGRPYAEAVTNCGEFAWWTLPLALAFSALLNSRSVLRQQQSDLSRLNAARLKRGKASLLDHIEVKLDLRPDVTERPGLEMQGERHTPRFHFVRGHPVNRAGKTFWRTSHYRGEASPAVTRNVSVRGAAPPTRTDARPLFLVHADVTSEVVRAAGRQ